MSDQDAEYWDEVENHLRLMHRDGAAILQRWLSSEECFVKDLMEFCKASYEAGFLDAVDEAKENLDKLSGYPYDS